MNTMTASKAKNNFGYLLEEVYVKGNSITITKNNKPIAKVSPVYDCDNTHPTTALSLNDKEYENVKKNSKKFKESFKFSF